MIRGLSRIRGLVSNSERTISAAIQAKIDAFDAAVINSTEVIFLPF